jgi:hypothetical protein
MGGAYRFPEINAYCSHAALGTGRPEEEEEEDGRVYTRAAIAEQERGEVVLAQFPSHSISAT